MELILPVYTYGHIDAMFYALNAMAMLLSSAFGQGLLMLVVIMSTVYYAMRMSYEGNNFKNHLGKFLGMIAMVAFLIASKTDMLIIDHVSKKKEKVDNLPVGFAVSVGILETFGDMLTAGFEQAFTPITNTSYRDYGMVFGARLIQESRNWRIRSPEFMENMSNFMDRCVMVDLMIGYYYTPEKLLKTDDMWGMVSENIGSLRQTAMRVGQEKVLMSCEDAVKKVLEPAFKLEVEALNKRYFNTQLGEAGDGNYKDRAFKNINSNLKKNIELAFKSYVGSNVGAEQLIRQQMMINAMKNYADEYGLTRALSTQESNWRIAGDLAGTYLPILMSVLKVLVYSSFIFMIPLLVMSGGWGRYLKYLTLVASFQLWAPLNSVLNMFIDIYSSSNLLGIADNIVSFSTMSRIGNYTDKIVAVASGLQMAIPFLAFGIIQGGVGSFIHLAGTITGASQAAASQAANESVTGNKGFDNYSVGNQQMYNKSGFKTDWNESYAAGGSSRQMMDGSMERVTGAGNTLVQSGVGFTAGSGATSYKLDDSHQAQINQGIQTVESLHQQDLRSLSNAQSNQLVRSADFISHLAQREHNGETFNYETMGEQGKALQQAVNHARQLHDNNSYDWKQAANTAAETSLSVGFKPFGIGADANIKAGILAENSNSQSVGASTSTNTEDNTSESHNNLIKAMSNSSWAKENSIDTGYTDSIKGSTEEVQRAEQQASLSKQRVDDYHQAKAIIETQGATSSKEMYQEVVDGIKQQYGVDAHTAQRMADQRSPEAQRVWQQIRNSDPYVKNVLSSISAGRNNVAGAQATERLDQFTKENKIDSDVTQKVQAHAMSQGLDANDLKGNIQNSQRDLKDIHEKVTSENSSQYKVAKDSNKSEESTLQKQVNKHEDSRIGKSLGVGGVDKSGRTITVEKGSFEKVKNDK